MLVLAMQILNLSVYGSSYWQQSVSKDGRSILQLNQIDSLAEYITEVLLDHIDAFPEQKENHTKNQSKTLKIPFQLFNHAEIVDDAVGVPPATQVIYSLYRNGYEYLFSREINPPPPKFA